MILPGHKTKIVCTIGPASRSAKVFSELVKNGLNVARLNFSHGTFEDHGRDIHMIRSVAARAGRTIPILVDLPGPKLRIGTLKEENIALKKGKEVILTAGDMPGTAERISVTYKRLPESVSVGGIIYLNDGFIQLKVVGVSGEEVRCRVVVGGPLYSHKGLNLPGAKVFVEAVSERDLECVDFGLAQGITVFGVSFVEKAEDLIKVRDFAEKKGKHVRLVAKIERARAVQNIDEILRAADGVMVARGDLGVEVPIEEVPAIQKRIIRKANLLGRPVITATQMLESMVGNSRPTRAEVTDVANAILDGTDAVMLSEETAMGEYPAEAVGMMVKIATSIEGQRKDFAGGLREIATPGRRRGDEEKLSVPDIISRKVVEAALELRVRFILVPTVSGATPRRISRFKPVCWVLPFTESEETARFLVFSYGVSPVILPGGEGEWYGRISRFLKASGLGRPGDRVILTESQFPGDTPGTDSFAVISIT